MNPAVRDAGPYAVSDLTGLIGAEFGPGNWFVIDQDQVDQFANATGDHQWIHQNSEAARLGPYKGPIAHGFLIMSMFASQWQQLLPIHGADAMINYGTDRVRFIAPVPVGSALRLHLKIDNAAIVPGATNLHLIATLELQGSDKPACVMQPIIRIVEPAATETGS